MRIRGEELLANLYGWWLRTVESTAEPDEIPRRWRLFAFRSYLGLQKVDNALQVTEDVYLARIYTSALDLFRVRTVSAAVNRKLAIIRDTYAALYDEASSSRAGLMEFLILLLIAVEIVLALVRH